MVPCGFMWKQWYSQFCWCPCFPSSCMVTWPPVKVMKLNASCKTKRLFSLAPETLTFWKLLLWKRWTEPTLCADLPISYLISSFLPGMNKVFWLWFWEKAFIFLFSIWLIQYQYIQTRYKKWVKAGGQKTLLWVISWRNNYKLYIYKRSKRT